MAVPKKVVGGQAHPASDWAYVPDPEQPSTWKLRLTDTPGGAPTPAAVGAAIAAMGPAGFRGQKVQIPPKDRPAVLKKVRDAWKRANPDRPEDEMPPLLKKQTFADDEPAETFDLLMPMPTEAPMPDEEGEDYDDDCDDLMTGQSQYHVHTFCPEDAFTRPPVGIPDGHRHPVLRNDSGRVIGFGETEGHEHPLPELPDGVTSLTERMKKVFCFDTDEAKDLYNMKNIDIFRAGKWNGDEYSIEDLDHMVSAFNKVGFQVPVKLGHGPQPDGRAFGWVASLRRQGDKLIANLRDIPKRVYDIIKERGLDTVSSEIFWNLKRNGTTFPRVLKAVALLGAETPGVSGLTPLRNSVHAALPKDGFEREVVYSTMREWTMDKIEELKAKIAELTKQLAEANEALKGADGKAFSEAQAKVTELTEKLAEMSKKLADATTESNTRVTELQQEVARLAQANLRLEERQRQDGIKAAVEKCQLPALRSHLTALYDFATNKDNAEKTVKFTTTDKDNKSVTSDETAVSVLDQLIATINGYTSKVFKNFSEAEDVNGRREAVSVDGASAEEIGEEIDRLTKDYMEKNKVKDYSAALQKVLALPENKDLRDAYYAA